MRTNEAFEASIGSRRMYLSSWPGLSPRAYLAREGAAPPPFPFDAAVRTYSFVARNLIYHLFRALGFEDGSSVLVPDFHHGNEVRAIRASGATIAWYHVRRDLRADLTEISRLCRSGPRALFLIHYLGWPQPVEEIAGICREHGVILVEDCALALLSERRGRPLGSFGEYSVFCLYKTLPVPNGGLLVQNRSVLDSIRKLEFMPCSVPSLAGRCLDLSLDWFRSRAVSAGTTLSRAKIAMGRVLTRAGVPRLPVGDTGFDLDRVDVGISSVSRKLLKRFDYPEIVRRRRRNFILLRGLLGSEVLPEDLDLEEGICPLFFPLLVRDKARAARELWRRGIGAIEFWNAGDAEGARDQGHDALHLRRHLLELPIHQDVTEPQIRYMAEQVLRMGLGL